MKIISEDGMEFATTDECLKYEKEQKNKDRLKDARYNEISSKVKEVKDLVANYNADYGDALQVVFSKHEKPMAEFTPFDYWFPCIR